MAITAVLFGLNRHAVSMACTANSIGCLLYYIEFCALVNIAADGETENW